MHLLLQHLPLPLLPPLLLQLPLQLALLLLPLLLQLPAPVQLQGCAPWSLCQLLLLLPLPEL
jgi:hypothetical protein